MIEFRDISFSYDKKPLLEHIDLRFAAGKITAVIGPNGCGKSTVLKLATALLKPQSGQILLGGVPLSSLKRRLLAQRVALLPQASRAPQMTVTELVLSGRYPYREFASPYTETDRRIADDALAATSAVNLRDKEVSRLSGGERQRVYLAMVLAQSTEIIFLDEPTTYLDINISYEIMELISVLHREFGKTIVMVLHDLSLALRYAQDIILMDKGQVVSAGSPTDILASGVLGTVFGVHTRCLEQAGNTYYCFDMLTKPTTDNNNCKEDKGMF
jgi:iron complex transport system ATP-binding protein